jgi:predicted DNA-binding transcriptional regulator AlpA
MINSIDDAKQQGVKFVTRGVLAQHLGIGERLFMKMVDKGQMPKGVKMGERRTVYDIAEFELCVERLKNNRIVRLLP